MDEENSGELCRRHVRALENLERRVAELEGSVKAFLDMHAMIGEESLNTFEMLLARLAALEKSLSQRPAAEASKSAEPLRPSAPAHTDGDYALHASVDRREFLSLQEYLARQKRTGKGEVPISGIPLEISYHGGEVVALSWRCESPASELESFGREIENARAAEWERDSEENLMSSLAYLIQKKTHYLGGLSRVLQKLSKKQLVERLCSQAPSMLHHKDGIYSGEALFHYLLAGWPDNGRGHLPYDFCRREISPGEGTSLSALMLRADRYLPGVAQKGKIQ